MNSHRSNILFPPGFGFASFRALPDSQLRTQMIHEPNHPPFGEVRPALNHENYETNPNAKSQKPFGCNGFVRFGWFSGGKTNPKDPKHQQPAGARFRPATSRTLAKSLAAPERCEGGSRAMADTSYVVNVVVYRKS
jgi:hypothetical protein